MIKEQQMQVCMLCKQQGCKPATMKSSEDASIAALEAKLRIISQSKERDVKKKKGGHRKNQHEGETEGMQW